MNAPNSNGAGPARPPRWPMLGSVAVALGLWGIYFLSHLDREAMAQGNNTSLREGIGAGIAFVFGGLIVGAVVRERLKPN